MHRARTIVIFLLASLALPAHAQIAFRYGTIQRGDMIMVGNTLAQECNIAAPPPLVGLVTSCGTNVTDSSPDVFWRADTPAAGEARADVAITAADARTTANLFIPTASGVTQAFLYWTARAPAPDNSVLVERPGVFSTTVTAQQVYAVLPDLSLYAGVADVTALVQSNRSGRYRVGDVGSNAIVNQNTSIGVAAWWLVVITSNDTQQRRSMAIYDGFPFLQPGGTELVFPLLEFTEAGTSALYVAAADGDPGVSGDTIAIDGTAIFDGLNPVNDVFNSTRSRFGIGATQGQDIPWHGGSIATMSGIDLDIFDITNRLTVGQPSTLISISTTTDEVWPVMVGILVPSTFEPPPIEIFANGFE
jgi:hypothetical protein